MLRYVYFLSLLLCINICFCYDHLSNRDLKAQRKFRVDDRRLKEKVVKEAQDNVMVHDKRPKTQIDVANFIQSPDEFSFNDNHAYGPYYESVVNTNSEIENNNLDSAQDYQNLESDNIPEVNIINAKHYFPQHINQRLIGEMNSHNNEPHKLESLDRIENNFPINTKVRHIPRMAKKCAFKNMKFPFFSHNKTETTKGLKNKKGKFRFRKFKKQSSSVSKVTVPNTNNVIKPTESTPHYYKVNKRSYFDRLCPACRLRYFSNANSDSPDESIKDSNNIIHNSGQYYQKQGFTPKILENDKQCNFERQPNSLENNVDFQNSMKDYRWKRHDETIKESRRQ